MIEWNRRRDWSGAGMETVGTADGAEIATVYKNGSRLNTGTWSWSLKGTKAHGMESTRERAMEAAEAAFGAREEVTPAREVYTLSEGGDLPAYTLCDQCIAATIDPVAAMRDVISRDDSLHCIGCDYHADPTCGAGHFCAAGDVADDEDEVEAAIGAGPGYIDFGSSEDRDTDIALDVHGIAAGDSVAAIELRTAGGTIVGIELTAADIRLLREQLAHLLPEGHAPVVSDGGRRCEVCDLLPEEHFR